MIRRALSQAGLRRGKAFHFLLRGRLALRPFGADGAGDGPQTVAHIEGGFSAWKKAGAPVEPAESQEGLMDDALAGVV